MSSLHSITSPIARRFILFIILFSSFITLVITAAQLYRDYNVDLDLIDTELQQIEDVHVESLSVALWTLNRKLLKTGIEGILEIRDIQYVEIFDEKKLLDKVGEKKGDNFIIRHFPLTYNYKKTKLTIGQMTIVVSLDGLYQRLIDKVWVILISNALKTFLVAIFIYFLFYNLMARHLLKISEYIESHDPLDNNDALKLDRDSKNQDEFDIVVNSINDMHDKLHEKIQEINQQKQHLSQTLNSIGDAVITTDVNGNITRMNPVAELLTGWFEHEAEGLPLKTVFPIINATTRKPIINSIEKVLSTGSTVYLSNDTTLISKNGTEYQIADSAAPITDGDSILGIVLVFNDVTEQYKLRQENAKSKRDLQAIMDFTTAVIYVKDLDGRYVFINKKFENLFHVKREDTIGKTDYDFFPKEFADEFRINDLNVIEAGHALESEEIVPQDDAEHVYISVKFPMYDDKNEIYAVCGISTDVTERKKSDEILRRVQKMDALGKLTGGVAHDFNNMLGVIMGYSDLLKDSLSNEPKLSKYNQEIIHATARGAKLTKKLLTFSKQKIIDPEVIDINKLLSDEKHMLEKMLTPRIKLLFDFELKLWLVKLDIGDLEDTILNISINSMYAINENGGSGELTIKTSNLQLNISDAHAMNIDAGDYVVLSIADTGCGMDEEIKDKIFDPFFTTKGDRGTGLGLSQVYGFVNDYGGIIKVYSEKEHGTQISLYFPRYQGVIDSENNNEDKVDNDYSGTETILVVDDEVALLELTAEILQDIGYNVICAERAVQALEILEKESIDLLLTDVIMPDMDGYELAAIVQEKYPNIKIQLASGFTDDRHLGRVDDDLHKNLLQKPYQSFVLLQRIRKLLS